MTFTYDGTPDTDLEKVRLEIGDTISSQALFSDEELNVYLTRHPGNVLLAAAAACDALATRFARDFNVSMDGQSLSRGQMTEAYRKRAQELRGRAVGIGVATMTRVDGYSDDLSSRDGAGQTRKTGRVSAGYSDPDLPS